MESRKAEVLPCGVVFGVKIIVLCLGTSSCSLLFAL